MRNAMRKICRAPVLCMLLLTAGAAAQTVYYRKERNS